jgi:ParB family protein of integrating conjugative element (PFGI_1 class)
MANSELRKRIGALGDRLMAPGFAAPTPGALSATDPPVSVLMQVPVDLIDPYDRNPRQIDNTRYERIRESIRASGLDIPVAITRRPGSDRYLVAGGGNTRLRAWKELWAEEQGRLGAEAEARGLYRAMPCVWKPYTTETDLITAHLRENDNREPLVYVDHALAVMHLKGLVEANTGTVLTRTDYERWLKAHGHAVSRRNLGRMEYVVAVLADAIPQALRAGLGPKAVDRIARLEDAFRAYYESLPEAVAGSPFPALFLDALSQMDGERLEDEPLRAHLARRVAEATGIPENRVLLGVLAEGRLSDSSGRPPESNQAASSSGRAGPGTGPAPVQDLGASGPDARLLDLAQPAGAGNAEPEAPPDGHTGLSAAATGGAVDLQDQAREPLPDNEATVLTALAEGAMPGPTVPPGDPAVPAVDRLALPISGAPAAVASSTDAASTDLAEAFLNPLFETGRDHLPRADDLKSLRSRVVVLAEQLAQSEGLRNRVRADREALAGFALQPLPAEASRRQILLWRLLEALSGGRSFDPVPRVDNIGVSDPAAFAQALLFEYADGRPPPDGLLRTLFLLIEAIVALVRAQRGEAQP